MLQMQNVKSLEARSIMAYASRDMCGLASSSCAMLTPFHTTTRVLVWENGLQLIKVPLASRARNTDVFSHGLGRSAGSHARGHTYIMCCLGQEQCLEIEKISVVAMVYKQAC